MRQGTRRAQGLRRGDAEGGSVGVEALGMVGTGGCDCRSIIVQLMVMTNYDEGEWAWERLEKVLGPKGAVSACLREAGNDVDVDLEEVGEPIGLGGPKGAQRRVL